jgi:hypothetical protein
MRVADVTVLRNRSASEVVPFTTFALYGLLKSLVALHAGELRRFARAAGLPGYRRANPDSILFKRLSSDSTASIAALDADTDAFAWATNTSSISGWIAACTK